MIHSRLLLISGAFALASIAAAQTQPQLPNLVPVPATPDITLPPQPKVDPALTKPLTAAEAAMIGLKLQPNVTVALAQARLAAALVAQSRAALLPSIDLNTGTTYATSISGLGVSTNSGGTTTTGGGTGGTGGTGSTGGGTGSTTTTTSSSNTFNGVTNSLTARQLLFDFSRTRDLVSEDQALARAAKINITTVQSDLIYQIKQQFYTVIADQRLVAVNEANLSSRQDSYNLALARLKAGIGEPADVVSAITNLADGAITLVQSRDTALLARITLAALMGIDPRTPLVLADSSEAAPDLTNVNALVDTALKQRPEIQNAIQSLRAAGYEVSYQKKGNLPALYAAAGVTTRGNTNPFESDGTYLGLTLSWNIFDSGLTRGLVQAAQASQLSAKATLVTQSQNVVSDVSQSYVNILAAQQRVDVAASSVANAQLGVQLSQGRYRAGIALFVELTTAQALLVTEQGDQVQAQTALQTARAQLARAIGQPFNAPAPVLPDPIVPGK